MLVMTPTSGSLMAARSAIWPKPRMAASRTSTSVPGGAARISSGMPMSVLKFAREATTRRWGASSAAISSLVEVLPTEPVTAITRAPSSRRHARPRRPSAASGSSAASTAPPDSSAAQARRDEHAPRTRLQRPARELAAVRPRAHQADEQVARARPRASR